MAERRSRRVTRGSRQSETIATWRESVSADLAPSDAPGGGQVVPAAACITPAAKQPVALTVTQRVMQDRLPGGLILQDADLAGGASRPKRTAMHRVQYRELNLP
jgi:hypothetical protein